MAYKHVQTVERVGEHHDSIHIVGHVQRIESCQPGEGVHVALAEAAPLRCSMHLQHLPCPAASLACMPCVSRFSES